MPAARLVLTSNAVAYSLLTLCRAAVGNFPLSPNEIEIQIPASTFEAANAGATLKIGRPDSIATPTTVSAPEWSGVEGDSKRYGPPGGQVDIAAKYLKGSVNNQVLYVSAEVG